MSKKNTISLLTLLLISSYSFSADIIFQSRVENPGPGESFEIAVLVKGIGTVGGVDLRLDFEAEIVCLDSITSVKIADLDWSAILSDGERGVAITGITTSGTETGIALEDEDTLAILYFTRLTGEATEITLQDHYPVMIGPSGDRIDCVIYPLALPAGTAVASEYNPDRFDLEVRNFPNPFNPDTRFDLRGLSGSRESCFTLYDILGRVVYTQVIHTGSSEFSIVWDGRDNSGNLLPGGTYIYQIRSGSRTAEGKCALVK